MTMDELRIENSTDEKRLARYLLGQGWATVGGRVEEYANEVESHGEDYTYWDIVAAYDDLADDVWRGVLVFLYFGVQAYYDEKILKEAVI